MPVGKAFGAFLGPGIIEQHRDIDQPGGQRLRRLNPAFEVLERSDQGVGMGLFGAEMDQIGGVGRADLNDAGEVSALNLAAD